MVALLDRKLLTVDIALARDCPDARSVDGDATDCNALSDRMDVSSIFAFEYALRSAWPTIPSRNVDGNTTACGIATVSRNSGLAQAKQYSLGNVNRRQ